MKQELYDKMCSATEKELYDQVYVDYLTGAMNRRAFEDSKGAFIAIVDLDSLKYVNDTLGHRWGDYQLCVLAAALSHEFGNDNVYRLSGDEFAVRSTRALSLCKKLTALRRGLPSFSFGVSITVEMADAALKNDKAKREATGRRAPRGECPPWINSLNKLARG